MCTEDVRKLKKRTGFFMIYFDLVHFNKKATFICKQIKLRIKMAIQTVFGWYVRSGMVFHSLIVRIYILQRKFNFNCFIAFAQTSIWNSTFKFFNTHFLWWFSFNRFFVHLKCQSIVLMKLVTIKCMISIRIWSILLPIIQFCIQFNNNLMFFTKIIRM